PVRELQAQKHPVAKRCQLPPAFQATNQPSPTIGQRHASCKRRHHTSETRLLESEIGQASTDLQSADDCQSRPECRPVAPLVSESDSYKNRMRGQSARGCRASAGADAYVCAVTSIQKDSHPGEIRALARTDRQTDRYAECNQDEVQILLDRDSEQGQQTAARSHPFQTYSSSEITRWENTSQMASRLAWRHCQLPPGHSPTGAEAMAGAGLGRWRRESATTGRENNPAGRTNFSRKLRCHNSNISRRHN